MTLRVILAGDPATILRHPEEVTGAGVVVLDGTEEAVREWARHLYADVAPPAGDAAPSVATVAGPVERAVEADRTLHDLWSLVDDVTSAAQRVRDGDAAYRDVDLDDLDRALARLAGAVQADRESAYEALEDALRAIDIEDEEKP